MMKLKMMIGAALLIALPVQAASTANNQVECVTAPELRAGLAFFMQEVVVALSSKCGPVLTEASYIRSKGPQVLARYADTVSAKTEVLNGLIKRLGPDLKIADGDPIAMKGLVSTMIATGVGKGISSQGCDDADTALRLLDPLPPENMIGLIEFAIVKVEASDRAKAKRNGRTPKRPFICAMPKQDPNSLDRK